MQCNFYEADLNMKYSLFCAYGFLWIHRDISAIQTVDLDLFRHCSSAGMLCGHCGGLGTMDMVQLILWRRIRWLDCTYRSLPLVKFLVM